MKDKYKHWNISNTRKPVKDADDLMIAVVHIH